MTNSTNHQCDVLVIGSGAAGLSLALRLADRYQVTVISKGPVAEGATRYAQGGIAAVFEQRDTLRSHISDTLIAGAGLCDSDTVAFVTRNARHAVEWLIDQGVCFDSADKHHYHLTREGGHSHRRILHCADSTGLTVETTLVSRAMQHPHLQLLPDTCAIDLQRTMEPAINGTHPVTGADLWHRPSGRTIHCRAQVVILATGGASGVYPYTTNPDSASGDGIAIAWRAGCRIANMEFNQFHPTCLYHAGASHFLLTEALRGEGAFLVRADGTRFMPAIDARAELAPRDIVARAIDQEISQSGSDCVYLDISHRPAAFIRQHFPMITDKLWQLGLDLTRDPIPVVPAAHYTCGGVMTSQYGRTDIPGLYAIGEVSYTGLHGANRLASNSLLECLVYGWSAADDIRRYLPSSATHHATNQLSLPGTEDPVAPRQEAMIQQRLHQLRQLMWQQAGITRTLAGLQQAETNIIRLQQETADNYRQGRYSASLLALRNLTEVALLIVRSAQQRKESRGLHSLTDYPHQHAATGPTILTPAR